MGIVAGLADVGVRLLSVERRIEVGLDIVDVLNADGYPDEIFLNPSGRPLGLRQLLVRRTCRMDD